MDRSVAWGPLFAVLIMVAAFAGCFEQAAHATRVQSTLPWSTVPVLGNGEVRYEWENTAPDDVQDAPWLEATITISLGDFIEHPLLGAAVQAGRYLIESPAVEPEDGDRDVSSYWAAGLPIAEGIEESLNDADDGLRFYNQEGYLSAIHLLYLPVIALSSLAREILPFGTPVEAFREAILDARANTTTDIDIEPDDPTQGILRYTFDGSPWPATVEAVNTYPGLCCDLAGIWRKVSDTFRPAAGDPGPPFPADWWTPFGAPRPVRPVPELDHGAQTWGLPEAIEAASSDATVGSFMTDHPAWFVSYAQASHRPSGDGHWTIRLADGEDGEDFQFAVDENRLAPLGLELPFGRVHSFQTFAPTPPSPEDDLLVLPTWDAVVLPSMDCPGPFETPPDLPGFAFHDYFWTGGRANATSGSPGLAYASFYAPAPGCDGTVAYAVRFGQLAGLAWQLEYTRVEP